MKIVFATGNEDKMREVREILGAPGREILSLKELGIQAEAEENGSTFSENAEIKAREIHEKLRQRALLQGEALDAVVLADDSGLCIDYLEGAPGVYSARWLGHDTPYTEKNRMVLEKLREAGAGQRGARFVCAICGVLENGEVLHTEGVMEGEIAKESSGENGFGYDPIFFSYELGKAFGEASEEEKNRVSHRRKAITKLAIALAI